MTLIANAVVDGATLRSVPLAGHQNGDNSTVSLHVAMSTLAYLATALAHLKADDYAHMRHMRIRLPFAKRSANEKEVADQQVAPGIIAALVLHELNAVQQAA